MKFTLFAAFLFSIEWMSVALADDGPPTDCCLSVSEIKISAERIVKYDKQNTSLCPVKAVRFHTKKNKVICSDPDDNWAKKVMKIVDGRPTTKPMCSTRTTKVIPITTTTDETSGTETEISMSTTVTPAVTTVKTSETETSTSTIVPTTVTTIKTSETETSTRTIVPTTVTTIKTSETETSTSTIVPTTVTTIKTSTPETEISETTILPTSVSTDNTESTAITCGTGEITTPQTKTTTLTTTTTGQTKKLSKMMIRKSGKSKKGLRRVQMLRNRHLNTTKPPVKIYTHTLQ